MVSNTITGIRILWNRVIDLNAKKEKQRLRFNFLFLALYKFIYLLTYIHTYLKTRKLMYCKDDRAMPRIYTYLLTYLLTCVTALPLITSHGIQSGAANARCTLGP